MILTVYVVLLALAVVAVGLGVAIKEPYFTLTGFFIIFFLGLALMTGTVEYKTGEEKTLCDFSATVDGNTTNTTFNDCVETVTDVYTSVESGYHTLMWWIGFLLSISTGFGMFMLFWNLRNGYEKKKWREKGE